MLNIFCPLQRALLLLLEVWNWKVSGTLMTRKLFFRPALWHYLSLIPSAHSAGRVGMCSIELNGMWRIGHPGSGNFYCKWLLSHQQRAFILFRQTYTFGIAFRQYPVSDVIMYIPPKCLHCRFSHRAGSLCGYGQHSITRSTQSLLLKQYLCTSGMRYIHLSVSRGWN